MAESDKPDPREEDPNKKQDFLGDFKRLNQNPPSVKDGPLPKKDEGEKSSE